MRADLVSELHLKVGLKALGDFKADLAACKAVDVCSFCCWIRLKYICMNYFKQYLYLKHYLFRYFRRTLGEDFGRTP